MIFLRYLLENMDWLDEELGGYEDDYLIFDCPGKSRLTASATGVRPQDAPHYRHPTVPCTGSTAQHRGVRTV